MQRIFLGAAIVILGLGSLLQSALAETAEPKNDFQKGVWLYRDGNYEASQTAFQTYLDAHPDHRPTQQWLSLIETRLAPPGTSQFMLEQIPIPPQVEAIVPFIQPAIPDTPPQEMSLAQILERAVNAEEALKKAERTLTLRDEQLKRSLEQTKRAISQSSRVEGLNKDFNKKLDQLRQDKKELQDQLRNQQVPTLPVGSDSKGLQNLKRRYEADLSRLRNENNSLRKSLDQQVNAEEATRSQITNEKEELSTELTHQQNRIHELENSLAASEQSQADLLSEKEAAIQHLHEEKSRIEKLNTQLSEENASLTRALSELKQANSAFRVAEASWDQERLNLDQARQDFTKENQSQAEQITHLSEELARVQLELSEAQDEITVRKQQIRRAMDQTRKMLDEAALANDKTTELNDRIQSLEREKEEILSKADESAQLKQDMAVLTKSRKVLHERVQKLDTELERAHQELNLSQQKLVEDKLNQNMEEKMALVHKIANLRKDRQDLSAKVDSMSHELTQIRNRFSAYQAASRERISVMEDTLYQTKQVLAELSESYQKSENDRLEAQRHLALALKDKHLSQKEIRKLTAVKYDLSERLNSTEANLNEVQAVASQSRQRLQTLTLELQQERQAASQAEQELRQQLDRTLPQIESMSSSLERMQKVFSQNDLE